MPTIRIKNEDENNPHFITMTIIEWLDIFTKPEYFEILAESLKFCRQHKGLLLFEYVFMTNHIHLIAQARQTCKLSQIISDFKKHTTREIFKLLRKDNRKYLKSVIQNSRTKKKGYTHQIWQRENCPKLIESEEFFIQKAEYIHLNPVKKGYVEKPEDWLYSSARNRILNDHSILEVDEWE